MAKHRGKKSVYAKNDVVSAQPNDLDNGYTSPIVTTKDWTFDNIKDTLTNSRYVQIVIALTCIGLFLRFYNLTFNSIWLDEASTVLLSQGTFEEIWNLMLTGDYNPPLFQWLTHFMLMFGNNEFTIRFVPAVAGVLSIPVMYLIGKEFIDRNVGIIVAAATTVSPFLIFYSQEARAYTLTFFVVAVEFLFYLKAMKSENPKSWILFGVFAAVSFWTHFYTLVITALLLIYTLVIYIPKIRADIKNIKPLLISAAVLVITTIPLLLVIIPLYLKRTSAAPTYGIQGFNLIPETLNQLTGFNWVIFSLFFLLFVIGTTQIYLAERWKGMLLVWILVATSAISIFMSYRIPMLPRYLIFLNIFLFLGIAGAYKVFYVMIESKQLVYVVMLLFFITSMTFLPGYYANPSKDDWRGFAGILKQITKPGDVIVLAPGYNAQPLDYYYSNETDETVELVGASAVEFNQIVSPAGKSVYYIVTGDIQAANPNGDAVAWLSQNAGQTVQHGNIYLLQKK